MTRFVSASKDKDQAQAPLRSPKATQRAAQMSWLEALLLTMRPKQWTKNFVIFLALLFSMNQYWRPFELNVVARMLALTGIAFALFCLLSGSVYLINDLADLEEDRLHPVKRRRPLASGQLRPAYAVVAAILFLSLSLLVSFGLNPYFGLVAFAYLASMIVYSFFLKHIVIVDVFTIAAGFVLRAVAGAVIIAVPISPWLYICTVLGALFLGFSKRRHELLLLEDSASMHRPILQEYTPQLLEQMIAVVTPSTVMAYSLYTFSAENLPKNHAMMLTIPFVIYGIFRYLYLVHLKEEGGSPEEVLLKDAPLIIDIALWLLTSATILFVFRGQ